jgi:hypothetical protein
MGRRSGLTHSLLHRALPVAAVLTVALLSSVVRADTPPPLVVRLPNCNVEPFPYEDFVQILRAQLAQERGPDITISNEAGANQLLLKVSGECGVRSAGVAFEITTTRGAHLRRNVPFFDLPMDVRGRGLAMVAAELVRAANDAREAVPSIVTPTEDSVSTTPETMPSQSQRNDVKRPGPKHAGDTEARARGARDGETRKEQVVDAQKGEGAPGSVEPSLQREREAHRSVHWGIAAQARMTTPTTTIATGARAQLRVGDFVAGADWLTSSVDDSYGTTRGNIVAGWVGLVVWNTRQPGWWIGTSPRASFGIAMADATAVAGSQGSVAREPYVDAAWQLDARWEFGKAGGLMLGADAGVARGMTAASANGPVLALGGWFVGARVGLEGTP